MASSLEFLKKETESRFVGVVSGDSVTGTVLPLAQERLGESARGHIIRLDEFLGGPTGTESEDFSYTEVVVYNWALAPSCIWYPKTDVAPTGTRHLFRATLRPDSLWEQGIPTFDIGPPRRFLVYPGTLEVRTPPRGLGNPTLTEFLELVEMAPLDRGCAPSEPFSSGVEHWIQQHPETRDSEVIGFILSHTAPGRRCLNGIRSPFDTTSAPAF